MPSSPSDSHLCPQRSHDQRNTSIMDLGLPVFIFCLSMLPGFLVPSELTELSSTMVQKNAMTKPYPGWYIDGPCSCRPATTFPGRHCHHFQDLLSCAMHPVPRTSILGKGIFLRRPTDGNYYCITVYLGRHRSARQGIVLSIDRSANRRWPRRQ